MASNVTANYGLSQWKEEDKVRRVDFNADNAKIDAAIKAVDVRVDGKAEASALASEVSTRASAVSSLNYSLARKGNCSIRTSSYTGDGATTKTLSFPSVPALALIFGRQTLGIITGSAILIHTPDVAHGIVGRVPDSSWSGSQLTVHSGESLLNESGILYQMVAFYDVS